jgi:hypothetical protein
LKSPVKLLIYPVKFCHLPRQIQILNEMLKSAPEFSMLTIHFVALEAILSSQHCFSMCFSMLCHVLYCHKQRDGGDKQNNQG